MIAKLAALTLLIVMAGTLSGCYQIGYVAGTGVNAVRHPIDTAGKVYRY
jgi:hypothetical protein